MRAPRVMRDRWWGMARLAVWLCLCLCLLAGCWDMPSGRESRQKMLEAWFPGQPQAQALAYAAETGDVDEIRSLMKDQGVDPDTLFAKTDKAPMLVIPVVAGQLESLRTMLELGADPNARYPTPTIEHFKDGSKSVSYPNNAMVYAAKKDDPAYLALLLDHGGNPDTRNSNNETLLFQARIWGNQWQNVKLLVERGADIDARTRHRSIFDTYAGMGGFSEAYWLLQHGANPMSNDPFPGMPKDHSFAIEAIFWHPGNPQDPSWQRRCQQWLLAHGYKRPPMPEYLRDLRKSFGFPYEEAKIPLL